jgi:hypothetical protein
VASVSKIPIQPTVRKAAKRGKERNQQSALSIQPKTGQPRMNTTNADKENKPRIKAKDVSHT